MSNNKYKILVVEDDDNIGSLVTAILESAGYQTLLAKTCAVAEIIYGSHNPDLIILDLGLPDRDGSCLLEKVRKNSLTPVIVLSARFEENDKVQALEAGANDYITKPFGSAELVARVRSALRSYNRDRGNGENSAKFILNELTIDYEARRIFLKGIEIKLTQTEYNIIAFLARNNGKMMTYSAIIKEVWGYPDEGSTKKLQVNMANIRKKFGKDPEMSDFINNEIGVGYRMESERSN